MNEEEKCPECSKEANSETIKGANLFMKRAFAEYKVKCAFDDCEEIIEYENIKPHEYECLEKLIPCNLCGEEIKRLELTEHTASQ